MTSLEGYLVRTVVTLLLVSGLAVLVLLSSKRAGFGRNHGPLSVAGRLSLDPKRSVYLVRIGKIYYVLGASEAGLTKLGEVEAELLGPPEALQAAPPPSAFRELLERLSSKSGSGGPPTGAPS